MYKPDFPIASAKQAIRPAHGSFYAVAGRLIYLEAYEHWAARLFDEYISGWRVDRLVSAPEKHPDVRVLVHSRASKPPPVPNEFESFEVANGGRCFTDGLDYFFRFSESVILLRNGGLYTVEVWPSEESDTGARGRLARMVFYTLMSAFRRVGLYELHAGAVVEPKTGCGVLFIGPSGSGKSTLTLQTASRGWRYLSDDSLLLSESDGLVKAWALRRAFALTEETVESKGVPRLSSFLKPPEAYDHVKHRMEPEQVFPEGYADACSPRLIFFPRVSGEARSVVAPMTQPECMSRLVVMCPWASFDRPASRGHLNALSALTRQSRSYELEAGFDLFNDPSIIAKLIAERAGSLTSC